MTLFSIENFELSEISLALKLQLFYCNLTIYIVNKITSNNMFINHINLLVATAGHRSPPSSYFLILCWVHLLCLVTFQIASASCWWKVSILKHPFSRPLRQYPYYYSDTVCPIQFHSRYPLYSMIHFWSYEYLTSWRNPGHAMLHCFLNQLNVPYHSYNGQSSHSKGQYLRHTLTEDISFKAFKDKNL